MNKLFFILAASMLLASGCSDEYDDSALTGRVDNLESRVEKLEELCKQMNTNISSLQTLVTALQDNDYITAVTPVTNGGKTIGYTITFKKASPITIYHGTDGKDGQDGTDGTNGTDGATPKIGVAKFEGVYYWTLNGEWLTDASGNKIKAEGTDGKDGQDGTDGEDGKPGEDGQDGKPGQDGKDGITPKLQIKDGYWWISYDDGANWERVGQATGDNGQDGKPGEDGQDGDSMFENIDYKTSSDYVIFTLTDGTQIQLPTWSAFKALEERCNQMNTNISSLQTIVTALQNNDYVKSVTPIIQDSKEIGYTLTFTKSDPITIYHGKDGQDGNDGTPGQDGITPVIGVKQENGIYYWTVDGDWLTDEEGNKIKAQGADGQTGDSGEDGQPGKDGITPQLRIEAGYWEISYDNGDSWTRLGKATGNDGTPGQDGRDGDSIFSKVEDKASEVVFTLADGVTIITIPKYAAPTPLGITFDTTESINVLPGKSYEIGYTLEGANEQTVIDVIAQNGYNADVIKADYKSGKIVIMTPETVVDDRIIVLVSDGGDRTLMRVINIAESILRITTNSYIIGVDGGTQAVEVETNLNYTVYIADTDRAWVSVAATTRAAVHTETLLFTFQPNQGTTYRYATVELRDASGMVCQSILFAQKASGYKTVHVATAGTLDSYISKAEMESLTGLEITGTLNTSDFNLIRSMPALESLDISQITNTTIPESCFRGNIIQQVILPQNLTAIPRDAFYQSEIKSIKIPESVISIGDQAFCMCPSLTGSLILPEGLRYIGAGAFLKCKKLTGGLHIPDSVTSLGNTAFGDCTGFTGSLTFGSNNIGLQIGSFCFSGCGFTGDLVIPDHAYIEESAFTGTRFTGSLIIGSGVESIGYGAFPVVNFSKVYCKATTPPNLTGDFSKYGKANYLGVPIGSASAYRANTYWKNSFTTIEEIEF